MEKGYTFYKLSRTRLINTIKKVINRIIDNIREK